MKARNPKASPLYKSYKRKSLNLFSINCPKYYSRMKSPYTWSSIPYLILDEDPCVYNHTCINDDSNENSNHYKNIDRQYP